MKERTHEAKALHIAGRKSADLFVEGFVELELVGEGGDAARGLLVREAVQASKEEEIFATGEARVETEVAASVISQRAADATRIAVRVKTSERCGARSWQQERSENAKKCGLACAVRTEEGDGFALRDFK